MTTTPPSITALPSAPDPTNRATFNTLAYPWSAALPTFGTQVSAVATNVKANADEAAGSATSAAAQVTLAAAQVTAASAQSAASAASAAAATNSANLKGTWASQTGAIAKPASVTHNSKVWGLLNNLADVTTSQPGVTADWVDITPAPNAYVPNLTSGLVTLASAGAVNGLRSRVTIDSDRELLFIGNGVNGLSAVCYDNSTKTFGTVVLVRAANIDTTHASILIATDKVLVASCTGTTTAFEAVVLTLSGTTITVNTAVTATLASACTVMSRDCCAAGSSYVFGMLMTTNYAVAITVSGTTPTIGTALNIAGNTVAPSIFAVDATRVLAICPNAGATTIVATPLTVSAGTTLTAGTTASTTGVQCNYVTALSTGRWAMVYQNTTTYGAIITLTGTVATISAVSLSAAGSSYNAIVKIGDQLLVGCSTTTVNVLTDASGTATAGTELTTGVTTVAGNVNFAGYGTDYGALIGGATTSSPYSIIKISGNNAYIYENTHTYAGAISCSFGGVTPGHRSTVCVGVVSNGTKSCLVANSGTLATNIPMGMVFGGPNGPIISVLPPIYAANTTLFRQSDSVYWSGLQLTAKTILRLNRMEMI